MLSLYKTQLCLLLFFAGCSLHAQEQVPPYGLLTNEEIILGRSQKIFSAKKVSELYITEQQDARWSLPISLLNNVSIYDTIFYGVRRNGLLHYYLMQNIEVWPLADSSLHINDSGWRGYDTTFFITSDFSPGTYCDYINLGLYDSIGYNSKKQPVYMRWWGGLNMKYTRNLFDSSGRLCEQQVHHGMPDGSKFYKAQYSYNRNNRLVEIRYGNIGKSKSVSVNDIFIDFEFPIIEKKFITYRNDGQVDSLTVYQLDEKTKKFLPLQSIHCIYKGSLLEKIIYKDPNTKETTYQQNIGYKFYKNSP